MASFIINESKYSLDSHLENTSNTARMLLENFNRGISRLSDQMNTDILANVHKNGKTYNIRNKKNAFIFLDFCEGALSLKYFTGEEEIEGLEKANWNNGSDHKGSKRFKIIDDNTLEKAFSFALQAYKIKKKSISESNMPHSQSEKNKQFNKQQLNDWSIKVAKKKQGRLGLTTKQLEENLSEMRIPYPLDFSHDQLECLYTLALHNEWRFINIAEKNIDYNKIKEKLWEISKNYPKSESYSQLVKLYKANLIKQGKDSISQRKSTKTKGTEKETSEKKNHQEIEIKLKKIGIKYPLPKNFSQLERLYKLALYHEWYVESFPNDTFAYNKIKDQLWEISFKNRTFSKAKSKLEKLYKTTNFDRKHDKISKEIDFSKNHDDPNARKEKSIERQREHINHVQPKEDSDKLKKIMKIVEIDLECFRLEEEIVEGGKISRHINSYERNPRLRANAINIHGTKCMACGFDFEKVYGKRGLGFIEVHHIKPVSTLDEEVKVNPRDDLIVLCSNCHRIVHRKKNDVLSLEKLKELLLNSN